MRMLMLNVIFFQFEALNNQAYAPVPNRSLVHLAIPTFFFFFFYFFFYFTLLRFCWHLIFILLQLRLSPVSSSLSLSSNKAHHNMMRALALEYFGWELATEGDAFLLAFHDCYDAVSFALTFQDALMDEVSC